MHAHSAAWRSNNSNSADGPVAFREAT